MSYDSYTHVGGTITNFTPDNNENTLYIESNYSMNLSYIMEKARQHFGESIIFNELSISSEHIHTRCLGYDQYDSSDWDNYLVIEKNH